MSENPVKIVVYIDFSNQKSLAGRDILNRVLEAEGSNVSVEYKICTPPAGNENAVFIARAVYAAQQQQQFHAIQDLLLTHDHDFSEEYLYKSAENLGLDLKQFKLDLTSKETDTQLQINKDEAEKREVHLIPALTINDRVYRGAWDEHALMEAIEKRGGRHVEIAIEGFFKWGAAAAFALLIATIAALVFTNMGYHETYEHWRHASFGFMLGGSVFQLPLEVWINDALMAVFFLLIGIEIKREVLYGELSDLKRAAMPVIAAIGGMVVPAILYLGINMGGDGAHGWGVPMATDIAFTLGLMALLGSRVPISLKVFVSALAVADDLGAILVIAIFYGHDFHLEPFIAAIALIVVMAFLNYKRVYSIMPYIVLGIALWFFIFESGVHATLAGVLTAILIPSRRSGDLVGAATQAAVVFDHEIEHAKNQKDHVGIRHGSLRLIQNAVERLREPSYHLEHAFEKWVNFAILPLFAFFNTGILLAGSQLNLFEPVNLGIIIALCIGKPLGIVMACWFASKAGLAQLSSEISWAQVLGAGCLAGVGFTMSIVVAGAAFHHEALDAAKISILIASALSALFGLMILYLSYKPLKVQA